MDTITECKTKKRSLSSYRNSIVKGKRLIQLTETPGTFLLAGVEITDPSAHTNTNAEALMKRWRQGVSVNDLNEDRSLNSYK